MEGVAFNLRQCVELFEAMGGRVSEVRLAEGGSRVERWCQIIADVLGRPVDLIEESDTSALGAAMAAEAAVTLRSPDEIAQRAVKLGRRYVPQRQSDYVAAYARYRAACRPSCPALRSGAPADHGDTADHASEYRLPGA